MLKTLREKTKVIIWFTVIAFIVSLFFIFGTNLYEKSKDKGIAKVGKNKVSFEEFREIYSRILNNQRAQNQAEITDEESKKMMEDAYQIVVENEIMRQISKESNIKVSETEIYTELSSIPLFRGPGGFDKARYEQFIYSQGYTPKQFEKLYKQDKLMSRMKYLAIDFYSSSKLENQYYFVVSNEKTKIEGINFSLKDFYDTIEYTEEDLKKFFEENKSDYFIKKKVKVEYYYLPNVPSDKDKEEVTARMEEILKQAKAGEDFAELAKRYSEGPSAPQGGDLNWISQGQTIPEFDKVAFSLKKGEISGIVETQFGLHIIKMEDEKTEEGKKLVRCRHILLKVVASEETKEEIFNKADELSEELKVVDSFDKIKEKYTNIQREETDYYTEDNPPFPQIRQAFDLADDEKVDFPIPLEDGYLVYKLLDVQPEHYIEFEKVKDEITSRYLKKEAVKPAEEKAKEIFEQIKDKEKEFALNDFAKEIGFRHFISNKFISGTNLSFGGDEKTPPEPFVGSDKISKELYLTPDFQIAGPFQYEDGFIIARVIERDLMNEKQLDEQAMQMEYFARYMKQMMARTFYQEFISFQKNKVGVESYLEDYMKGFEEPVETE
ncbi:MAG: peptidylprolyl isomerase [bacterium]|nr:peptidylprolyl isomerase [bacterium]